MIIINVKYGKTFEMQDSIGIMSNLLKEMYYENTDISNGEIKHENDFNLVWIELDMIKKYNDVCQLLLTNVIPIELMPIEEFLESDINKEIEFDNITDLFKLLNLANFLDCQPIIKLINFKIDKELEKDDYDEIIKKYEIEEELNNNLECLNKMHILNDLVMDDADNKDE